VAADTHAERIAAASAAVRDLGNDPFINARTDVWWYVFPAVPKERFRTEVERLQASLAAGADGAFAPGFAGCHQIARSDAAISQLAAQLGRAPLNVLAGPSLPPLRRLRELGVRRMSTGSSLYRLAMASAARACAALLENGEMSATSVEAELSYADLGACSRTRTLAGPRPEEWAR
jgi:2-methylisocitrate lyase-like PEP mutase family enzyme